MRKICISGATGQIGQSTIDELLKLVPASSISLTTRNPEKLSKEKALGMQVHKADYSDIAALEKAYNGCDALFLISGAQIGSRVEQHKNALTVAEKVGIKHIVYTSVSGCHPMNPTPSSVEHYQTEEMLQRSNLSFTILRNHFYSEYIKGLFLVGLRTGQFHFPGDRGLISPVSIKDIARCAAVILSEPEKHKKVVYEITGPDMFNIKELCENVAQLYDVPIEYVSVSGERMYKIFNERGIPFKGDLSKKPPHLYGAAEVCANYIAIDDQYHAILTRNVEFITGKKATPLNDILTEGKERWLKAKALAKN